MDTEDWVELFNPQNAAQNISGWTLKDDDDAHSYSFPAGSVIPAFGYMLVCRDSSAFKSYHPQAENIAGNLDFGLGRGDQVRLFSPAAELVDSVAYLNDTPWPAETDGGGPSLELTAYDQDNSLFQNWQASTNTGGSPGYKNSTATQLENVPGKLPEEFQLFQNYPNPFNPKTAIKYRIGTSTGINVQVELNVYNILGQKVKTLVKSQQPAGNYIVTFDASFLSSGIYFAVLHAGNFNAVRKMILMR